MRFGSYSETSIIFTALPVVARAFSAARKFRWPRPAAAGLEAFVRNVLGDGRDEVGRREYLEITVDLLIHLRAIDYAVTRAIELHLVEGKGVAYDLPAHSRCSRWQAGVLG